MKTGKNWIQAVSSIGIIQRSSTSHPLCLCSFHVLGNAVLALQHEFYTMDRLAEEIAGSAFVSLDHVPDHRLRPIFHILLCVRNKKFVAS